MEIMEVLPVDFCVHFSVLMCICLFVFFFYVWPLRCICGDGCEGGREGIGGEGGINRRVEIKSRTCVPLKSLWDITECYPYCFVAFICIWQWTEEICYIVLYLILSSLISRTELRIISWNVDGANNQVKCGKISKHLKRFSPDIIFLQETCKNRKAEPFKKRMGWRGIWCWTIFKDG